MKGLPALEAVLQLMSCKYMHSCKLADCSCLAHKLKCTDMCKPQTCTNQRSEDEEKVQVDFEDF